MSTIAEAITSFKENEATMNQVVEGDSSTTVTTPEGNSIKSVSKTLADMEGRLGHISQTVANIAALDALDITAPDPDMADGSTVRVLGYYSEGDGGGGVYELITSSDTVTSVLRSVTNGSGRRWRRQFNDRGRLNAAAFGVRGSATEDQYATANKSAFDDMTDMLAVLGGGELFIPDMGNPIYCGGAIEPPDDTTVRVDGYLKSKKLVDGDTTFRLLTFNSVANCKICGNGTIDGAAHVDDFRASGTNCVYVTGCLGFRAEQVTITNSPVLAVSVVNSRFIHWNNTRVLNATGSVDTEASETTSGDNQDGIHFYNCSDIVCTGNYVESIDDSIAWTYNANTASVGLVAGLYRNGVFCNNICRPLKAERVHDGSVTTNGTEAKVLAHGFRFSVDGSLATSGATVWMEGLVCSNNIVRGGLSAILLGNSGSSAAQKFVQRGVISNNVFTEIAREFEDEVDANDIYSDIQRGSAGVIRGHSFSHFKFNNNQYIQCGVPAYYVRGNVSDVEVSHESVDDVDINTSAAALADNRDAAGLVFHATVGDIDRLQVTFCRALNIDGGGFVFRKEPARSHTGIVFRNNFVRTANRSNYNDVESCGFSMVAVTDSGLEFEDNKVENHTVNGDATEYGPAFDAVRKGTLEHDWWSFGSGVLGGGYWQADTASGGTVSDNQTVTSYNGKAVRVQSLGIGEGMNTIPLSSAYKGKRFSFEVALVISSGSVKIGAVSADDTTVTTSGLYVVEGFFDASATPRVFIDAATAVSDYYVLSSKLIVNA